MTAKAPAAAPAAPAAPTEPEPRLQQDIHFVLRIEATLKPPEHLPAEPVDPTTSLTAPLSSGWDPHAATTPLAPAAPPLNPASLALQLNFTPWTGPEIQVEPAELAALGQPSPSRASTPPTTGPGRVSPAPAAAAAKGGKGAPTPPPPEPAAPAPPEVTEPDTTPKWWCAERHFKASVDDAFVRAMAEAQGVLNLPITLTQPPAEPPPKAVKGQPPPPEPIVISFTSILPLHCASLLVGDTEVKSVWPSKLQPMPAELGAMCSTITITLKALSMPEPTPEEAAAAAAAASKGKPAAKAPAPVAKGAKGGKDAPPEPDLSSVPGDPITILTPALASRLNPLVIMPLRANAMPDAPATPKLLDSRCEPVKLRIRWPPGASTVSEQVGRPGDWETLQPKDSRGPGLSCRAVGFGQPQVFLAGDLQLEQLLCWCKESPLTIEVHDRTVIPEPPEFPIKAQEGVAVPQQEDEGYVCGIARVPLLDLVRGRQVVRFTAPLAPHTTIRGAASLDWGRRPGNYAASSAVIKGWVRCAVPLSAMVGVSLAERVYSRAVFTMDYRDSTLFHLLEDTIRQQNAWALGLAAPERKLEAPASPTERHRRSSSQHNSRNSTPNRTHNSDSEAGSPSGPRGINTSHSTHSVGPGERQHSRNTNRSPVPALAINNSSRGHHGGHSARHLEISDAAISSFDPTTPQAFPHSMERNSSMGTGTGGGQTVPGAPRVVLWSAPQSTTGKQDRKELRFHNFDGGNESVSSDESDVREPDSAVEIALQTALSELETIKLDNRLVQTLSTTKLTPEQATDHDLDLLTGWHVVDGKERIIAVEGKQAGAMRAIQAIITWALEDAKPEDGWQRRGVLFNSGVLYSSRLWADLGVDLHIVKLHAPLPKIIADANSYATGKVRVDCIAGLRRLAAVRAITWARLVDDLALYPTPHMLHLVDKKFGGELTKADVFGVEAQEFDTDEEDGGGMGLVKDDDVRSSHSSSKRSAKSARSRKSLKSKRSNRSRRSSRYTRKRPPLQPLDRHNEAYIHLREEARAHRLAADWHAHNLEHITSLASTAANIRATWSEWNPQREAARMLEDAVKKGTLRLEDTFPQSKRAQIDQLFSGVLSAREARLKGWAPHGAQFKWPAPKDPGSYAVHPHAPSMFRKEQLAEAWEESTAGNAHLQTRTLTGPNFITTVKNDSGLFGQDPEFWKTVHMSGTSRELEETERKAAEKNEWSRKLAGDPILHVTLPLRTKTVSMTDRTKHILIDAPRKKGFAIAHVPPAPYSMHLAEPWTSSKLTGSMRQKPSPQTFTLPNVDFKRCLAVPKSSVSKPGHGHLQSWTASIHDRCYHDE